MVVIVMGEIKSASGEIGRVLADSLAWEFADIEEFLRAQPAQRYPDNAGRDPEVEQLSALLQSFTCQWRDLIVSCPILTHRNRRQLQRENPLAKFVFLTGPHASVGSFGAVPEDDDRLLFVDSSQKVEQIVGTVLSALILKQPTANLAPD